ncbi:MAG TPA: outer membrane protein assembly factor BamD [Usitatibacter sp.]|nr:outer membrane protein assembly factor BamD [Usitatibacter sp.]
MVRSVTALAALALVLVVGGCSLFGKVIDPRKDWQAADYYKAAKTEFDAENWDASIKIYDQLEAKFPFGRFAQQAALESAYAYYRTGETAQCVSTLDKFVKAHPNHPNVDYALYLKALANFKEDLGPLSKLIDQDLADRDPKAARESFEGFKDLVARYPESKYVDDSRERMAYLVEALARHEVNVARYYLHRRAYLAAANRAQETLFHFPSSPSRRDALEIMIESYDRMGMIELRDDAKRVLAKNYPADPLVAAGKNSTRVWYKPWTYW